MKVTIKEIASLSGVSTTTVSKIINHKDDSISQQTKDRVKGIMEEYQYSPNNVARALVTKKSNCIGIIIPDIRNPFFPELIRGVEDMAQERDYNLIICNTDDAVQKQNRYLDILQKRMVDGIILTASSLANDSDVVAKSQTPIVLVDRDIEVGNVVGKIMVDNEQGAHQATEYLIQKKCKKIIFLSGSQSSTPSKERWKGFQKAMQKHGLEWEDASYFGNFNSKFGYEMMAKLIQEKKAVEGVFCASDLIALGAIKAIKEKGFLIPKDIKVIGFDDIYMAAYMEPSLTTVRQPIYDIGKKAAGLLIDAIENYLDEKNKTQFLQTKLIERESALER